MTSEGKSKRQLMREKRQQAQRRNRLITIGLIAAGALLIAFFLIYPNLQPVGAIKEPTSFARPQVQENTVGDPNAPIKIEEFSDFQCPYCQRFYLQTEEQLISTYVATGKVYFVYRSFGEFIGPESRAAAEAAYCAGDQNKFWEMHDLLFTNHTGENVGDFTNRRLQAFGEKIGLDMRAFGDCLSSGKYSSRVDQDFADGRAAGVKATPSFVLTYTVNGQTVTELIEGAQPFSEFQSKIEAALTAMGK
ncbi:MAG: DsbA family protein [Anaerolineae bacterium]